MPNPRTPVVASVNVPPPIPHLPVVDLRTGNWTTLGMQYQQTLWAAIFGSRGIDDQITATQVTGLISAVAGLQEQLNTLTGQSAFLASSMSDALSRIDNLERYAAGSQPIMPPVQFGTYTPTLTNVANLDASTAFQCQYLSVGWVVGVSGKVSVDPTAAGNTQLGISLPIFSTFTAQEQCGGTVFASGIAGQGAAIRADATNFRAEMVWIAVDTTNQPMYFSFIYLIT